MPKIPSIVVFCMICIPIIRLIYLAIKKKKLNASKFLLDLSVGDSAIF